MLTQLHIDIATLGDLNTVFQCLGDILKQLRHFFRRLQILLFAVLFRSARIAQHPALTDANAGFVRFKILAANKPHVISGDYRTAFANTQGHCSVQVLFVVNPAGALQFQIKTAGENTHPVIQQFIGCGR